MDNTNSQKLSTYRGSYIVAFVLFFMLFSVCMTLFNLVEYESSGIILNLMRTVSCILAFTVAIITAARCAKANKIKNPGVSFTPVRDVFYYLKQIAFFTVMIILMSVAASMVGMAAAWVFGGIFYKIDHTFFSGFLLKLPIFILYLTFVYRMFVRFGFMDSQKKIFNPDLKLLSVIIAFFILTPGLVGDNYFYLSPLENNGWMNVQTVLSPNEGVDIIDEYGRETNENFGPSNVVLIALTSVATLAVQAAVFSFAYKRGKRMFIKQHIREVNEYEMDENL